MKTETQKSKRELIIYITILLAVLGVTTYLFYRVTNHQKKPSNPTPEWSFLVNGQPSTLTEINLTKESEYTRVHNNPKIKTGLIGPGSSGEFDIEIDGRKSKTSFRYTITFSQAKKVPTNLKFYLDDTYHTEIDVHKETEQAQDIIGTVTYPITAIEKRTIYWKWEKESEYPLEDQGQQISIQVKVTGEQV